MKSTKPTITTLLATAAAALALLLTGCSSMSKTKDMLASSKPVAQNIKITVDKTLENTSIQIDLLGASTVSDLPKWQTYSVTEYWQPGNTTRRDTVRVTLDFGTGKPATQTLPKKDPMWKRWLGTGSANLVILADLPGIAAGGTSDPRRLIIPLDAKSWKKSSGAPIEILVQESGLRLLTPRN
jgi:hypothetical protein